MSTLDGDGSGRYLCVPYPDALVKAWADPLRKAGVAVMPGIKGWPDVWPVAGREARCSSNNQEVWVLWVES